MNLRRKGRSGKLVLAGALAAAMAVSPVASYLTVPAQAAENDELLYLVNCGTKDSSVVPNGYSMGTSQSNVDQEYGEDSTGYTWGYDSQDLTAKKDDSDPSDMSSSSWYISDQISF